MDKRIVNDDIKSKNIESKECLILYADIMGFKNMVYNLTHDELKERLENFTSCWKNRISPLLKGGYLKSVQFSDSIIMIVDGIEKKMFNLISKAAICLIQEAMKVKFPIKGVIAQGIFSFSSERELYFGKPLVDAYLLHEELKYYGIVVHNTAEKTVKRFRGKDKPYKNTPIFLEKSKISHYHLCWNLVDESLSPKDITNKCEKWLHNIEELVSGYPRIYIDNTLKVLKKDSKQNHSRKFRTHSPQSLTSTRPHSS